MSERPQLARFPSASPVQSVLDSVERQGGAIIEGLLHADLLARLNGELDAEIDGRQPGSRTGDVFMSAFHGRRTKRFCGLAGRAPSFVEVLLHPTMQAFADRFLLPNCGSYWVNTTQMMVVGPGEPAQYLHRDQGNWPHFPWPGFELTVSCMFALGEFREDNGATLVVPGSNLWENEKREPELAEIGVAEMAAGSALLYTGKLIHGAGANRTQAQWRRGMHLSFVVGWLRPEENHYLAVPLEQARRLPERARQLLGYASYHPTGFGGRLGLVDFEEAAAFVGGSER